MPGANFWAVLLFFTLIVLGFSSAFVMLDVVATLLVDSGLKLSRPWIVTGLTLISFLMCIPYCTEFGYYLLDGIDRWVNNIALIFVVWTEVVSPTTAYRYLDVVDQVGLIPWYIYQAGYFGGQILGVALAQGVSAPAGVGAGFGLYFACLIAAIVMAKAPTVSAPTIQVKIPFTNVVIRAPAALRGTTVFNKIWWMAFYSVCSLSTHVASRLLITFPGQPTPPRPQHHRRSRQELEDPGIPPSAPPLHLRSSPHDHLQLRLPRVPDTDERPLDDPRFHRGAYRHGHHSGRLHLARMVW